MRWLTLYLRSRSVPATLAAVTGSTVALWLLSQSVDAARVRDTLALLAVLVGTAATAPGLAGADPDLERTAAFAWPPRRAAHIILAGAAVLALTAPLHTGPAARNITGMAGLVAFGAATLGASRAWLIPCLWTMSVLPYTAPLGVPPAGPIGKLVFTWMIQPPETNPATVTAVLLGATGTLTYAIFGPAGEVARGFPGRPLPSRHRGPTSRGCGRVGSVKDHCG